VAHTLVYDAMIMDGAMGGRPLPPERVAGVAVAVLVIDGDGGPAWARNSVAALAAALPQGRRRTLEGQYHGIAPEVLAPALEEFFAG
jgi:hypothetical protein